MHQQYIFSKAVITGRQIQQMPRWKTMQQNNINSGNNGEIMGNKTILVQSSCKRM